MSIGKRLNVATALLAAVCGISLAGCAGPNKLRSLDGAAQAFTAPPYVVKGKTAYDQAWIDDQVEAGVGALGWDRPKPRPAALDAAPAKAVVKPTVPETKKPSVWRRVIGR